MGLPIGAAPPLLLPVLADIVGGEGFFPAAMVFLGRESQRGNQQASRMPAERHRPGEASALQHHAHSASTNIGPRPRLLLWNAPMLGLNSPSKSCAATQVLSVDISSIVKACGSHSALSVWTAFLCFVLDHSYPKLSWAQ